MKTLFTIAGEISGDSHAAALLECLPDDWRHLGLGGPKMASLSSEFENWLDDAAVLGLWEVLKNYRYFSRKMKETRRRIHAELPDAIMLVDYPGFNLLLASKLRRSGYAGKILFYISPQVWAWKKGRIKKMARLLDLLICIFPFEKALFEKSGLPTDFCGHPLVDSLAPYRENPPPREENLIAFLPGSREREIGTLFPAMLSAAGILKERFPHLQFATSGATPLLTEKLQKMVEDSGLADCFSVAQSCSHDLMQRAWVGIVASGTATLEAACLGLPYLLTYKVAPLTAFAARRVLKIKYLGIVNVIANRPVVKELLQEMVQPERIAEELDLLIHDSDRRTQLQKDLAAVAQSLGEGGAHQRAADSVMRILQD